MKKTSVLLAFVIATFFLSGYATDARKAQDVIYLTIHYDHKKIMVTDKYLKPAWYNQESQDKFKPIYQREPKDIKNNFPELYQIIKKIESEVNVNSFDGTVHFDPKREKKFWVTGAREGRVLDCEKLGKEMLEAIKGKKHADIIAPIVVRKPKAVGEVLDKIGLRTEFSTRFDASNSPRVNNIELSMNCFNGVTLANGERISFNKTVGRRTLERGYQEANIILDGEFVKGAGGGVCQTSTTLFNAALLSGLSVVSSCNHSLPISYVPLGRDAMVSSAVDLVLENNTGSSIYIETGVQGNKVFAKIYGSKMNGVVYKPKTEVTEKPTEEEVQGDKPPDLKNNPHLYKRVVIEHGDPARTALTYLEIYKGDKLIGRKLIRKSNYNGKKEVVRYDVVTTEHSEERNEATRNEAKPS